MPRASIAASRAAGGTAFAAALLAGLAVPASGAVIVASDVVSFATQDQPLWAEAANRTASFDIEVVNTGPMSRTIGSIGTVAIANPNYAQQVAACGLNPGCVLAVPLTIDVPHGARAVLTGRVAGGFSGDIALATNRADVGFSAVVDVRLANPDATPGTVNTISLTPRDEAGSIATTFTAIEANIRGHLDEAHSVTFDVFQQGERLLHAQHTQVNPTKQREVLDLALSPTTATVAAFGEPAETVDLDLAYTKTVRVAVPQTSGVVQLPLGDVTVFGPDFDLDPPGSVLPPAPPDLPATHLQNEKLPGDRLHIGKLFEGNSGATPVDFARLEVDGNVWCMVCGTGSFAFQVPTAFPLPTAAGIEIRPANTDIGAYFGIGQTGVFEPNLMAHILFSQPVLVDDPDLGLVLATMVTRPVDGSDLAFVMPEGDLDIEVFYSLAGNRFTDILDLFVSPARTVITLGIEIYGASFLLDPIRGEYALFTDTLPFGDPRNVGNLHTETTTLAGFEDQAGSRLSFRNATTEGTSAAAIPEPAPLAALALALALVLAWRRAR